MLYRLTSLVQTDTNLRKILRAVLLGFLILAGLVLLFRSTQSYGSSERSAHLELKGPVTDATTLADEIVDARNKNQNLVYINIDSPGGYVYVMLQIMDEMEVSQSQGTKFVCTITRTAASAAFLIFNTCDVRQVYDTSMLMWHSVGLFIMGGHNIVTLRALLSHLEAIQFWANERIQAKMKLDPLMFEKLWTSEITVTGRDMHKLAPHYVTLIKR